MSKVMIIDDDPLVRSTTRRIAEADRHEVMEAGNGKAALELFETETPDVVLQKPFGVAEMRRHLGDPTTKDGEA